MKKLTRISIFLTALGAIGLQACDAAPPPTALKAVDAEVVQVPAPAPESPGEAARMSVVEALRDPDPYARARRLGALLPTLGRENARVAPELLQDPAFSFNMGGIEFELLLRYWATHQPEEASRWAVFDAPPTYRTGAVFASLPVWAEADPQAALASTIEWTEKSADMRQALQVALVMGWFAAGDPPELQQYMLDLGPGYARQRAVSAYVRSIIGRRGSEAAIRWAEATPDDGGTYKLDIYRQMAFALAVADRDAAIRWCKAHCDGPFGNDLRNSITTSWMRTDPPGAFQWLSTQPEGAERNFALKVNFTKWVRTDKAAAMAWMALQTASGDFEAWLQPTIALYARTLAETVPAEAIVWAARITNDTKREFVLVQTARAWRKQDPEAAEAWMLESPLSELAKEEVRAEIPIGLQQRRAMAEQAKTKTEE